MVSLSEFKTNYRSGWTNLYITYNNLGNYGTGKIAIPLEKAPLVYKDGKVGIGISDPDALLHIKNNKDVTSLIVPNLEVSQNINVGFETVPLETVTKTLSLDGGMNIGGSQHPGKHNLRVG